MAHTQGKWLIGKGEIFRPASSGSISPYYEQICGFVETGSKECKDNAKLIAAAPELLEACKKMIQAFNNAPQYWLITDDVMQAENIMIEAIKKATE